MTMVSRNAFARTELHKFAETVQPDKGCAWCGGNKQAKSGRVYLYRFETQSDGGRKYEASGLFCCVSCFRSYHGN